MHFITLLAFACLFWEAEAPPPWRLVSADDHLYTLALVLSQIPLLAMLSAWAGARVRRQLADAADNHEAAYLLYHRAAFLLRVLLLLGFGVSVFGTNWTKWFSFRTVTPELQILGDLVVLAPFFVGAILLWVLEYRIEKSLRGPDQIDGLGNDKRAEHRWRFRSYLDFNIRHHLLVVAGPLLPILFAANVLRGYEKELQSWSGWASMPEAFLGGVAATVFLTAPWMLARIWRTNPLPAGPLRDRLEGLCQRIGLKCRDILVWQSGGVIINAAVMGIFPPIRYVLLSDALLESMTPRQIEAVFGHEAGHVRLRHIQYFLLCAFVGWLATAGVVELLDSPSTRDAFWTRFPAYGLQGLGIFATVGLWCLGFGWVSRRFERQADLFGVRCVSPTAAECRNPCSVHSGASTFSPAGGSLCATGVEEFTAALEKVAALNGIPWEEKSWRHSSIARRVRFLRNLAEDPFRAQQFDHLIRRIKTTLLVLAIAGVGLSLVYWSTMPPPGVPRAQASLR